MTVCVNVQFGPDSIFLCVHMFHIVETIDRIYSQYVIIHWVFPHEKVVTLVYLIPVLLPNRNLN